MNEIFIVSQATEDTKKGKMYAVNFVSHGTTSEQEIKRHQKNNKSKGKSKKLETGEPHLKPKKPHLKGNCQFCKKYGHKKVDCFKYKKWLEKKKKGTF